MSSGLFSPIPDDRSNPALGLPPPPRDTVLHRAQWLVDTVSDAVPVHSAGDQLAETPPPPSETQDDSPATLPYLPKPRPSPPLPTNQVARR
jgi:hypothetical protein